MSGSEYEDSVECPLCCTELDLTDRSIKYCDCGYQMCLWCYHHILEEAGKENLAPRCPNCRSVYDQNKIQVQHIDAEKLAEEKKKLKNKDKARAGAAKGKAHLSNVRVVQPNLVYVVGLPLELCDEDILSGPQHFGAFGRIVKVSVNRVQPTSAPTGPHRHGVTGSAYVTFRAPPDALRCIRALDGSSVQGRQLRACFGTTKYCNAFLRGVPCNNPDCLYLHTIADEEDCLTKEEVAAGLLPARFMALGASNTACRQRVTIHTIGSGDRSIAVLPRSQAAGKGAATVARQQQHEQQNIAARLPEEDAVRPVIPSPRGVAPPATSTTATARKPTPRESGGPTMPPQQQTLKSKQQQVPGSKGGVPPSPEPKRLDQLSSAGIAREQPMDVPAAAVASSSSSPEVAETVQTDAAQPELPAAASPAVPRGPMPPPGFGPAPGHTPGRRLPAPPPGFEGFAGRDTLDYMAMGPGQQPALFTAEGRSPLPGGGGEPVPGIVAGMMAFGLGPAPGQVPSPPPPEALRYYQPPPHGMMQMPPARRQQSRFAFAQGGPGAEWDQGPAASRGPGEHGHMPYGPPGMAFHEPTLSAQQQLQAQAMRPPPGFSALAAEAPPGLSPGSLLLRQLQASSATHAAPPAVPAVDGPLGMSFPDPAVMSAQQVGRPRPPARLPPGFDLAA